MGDTYYLKYRKGVIIKQVYKNSVVEKTFQHLQISIIILLLDHWAPVLRNRGEFKHPKHKSTLAMKIVLEEEVPIP